jgi:hypothetical protein
MKKIIIAALLAVYFAACTKEVKQPLKLSALAAAVPQNAFSLWGSCTDKPYLISGTNGVCVPEGGTSCSSNYLGAQQSGGQTAHGLQFTGCFKGGSNAPNSTNEMAVFLADDVSSWTGHEMGFVATLNDHTIKAYVQGGGHYNYLTLLTNDNGYHTFKCLAQSADHSKVDFYLDGVYKFTIQNSGSSYYGNWFYFVGTTHRTSSGWSAAGQQIEMYDMTTF